jgi:hypothetical protein
VNTTNEKQKLLTAVTASLRQWVDGFLIAKRARQLAQPHR